MSIIYVFCSKIRYLEINKNKLSKWCLQINNNKLSQLKTIAWLTSLWLTRTRTNYELNRNTNFHWHKRRFFCRWIKQIFWGCVNTSKSIYRHNFISKLIWQKAVWLSEGPVWFLSPDKVLWLEELMNGLLIH